MGDCMFIFLFETGRLRVYRNRENRDIEYRKEFKGWEPGDEPKTETKLKKYSVASLSRSALHKLVKELIVLR